MHYTASNWLEGCITGKVGIEEDNVIPPYAFPGESLNCNVIRSGWVIDHVYEENMVAVSARERKSRDKVSVGEPARSLPGYGRRVHHSES